MGERREWVEVLRVGGGRLYAALRVDGLISISGWTHERMGAPEAYVLLVEREDVRANPASAMRSARSHQAGVAEAPPPLVGQEGSFGRTTPSDQGGGQPSFIRRGVRTIGLRAARLGVDKNAYRVRKKCKGTNKNRTIFARPLCQQFGIGLERTIVFRNCRIDEDGVLILDLGETRQAEELEPRNNTKEHEKETRI